MCFCTVPVLKVSVVITILLLALFNALGIAEGIKNMDHVKKKGQLLLIVCFVLNSFLIVVLCVGLYAAIREHLKLLQLLIFVLVSYFLGKMALWIVAGSQGGIVELLITHHWYKMCLVAGLVCILLLTCYCLRLRDDDGEDPSFR